MVNSDRPNPVLRRIQNTSVRHSELVTGYSSLAVLGKSRQQHTRNLLFDLCLDERIGLKTTADGPGSGAPVAKPASGYSNLKIELVDQAGAGERPESCVAASGFAASRVTVRTVMSSSCPKSMAVLATCSALGRSLISWLRRSKP